MKKVFVSVLTLVLFFGISMGQVSAATDLTTFSKNLIGTKYLYGGTTTKGFDCSGFTSYVYKQFGIELDRRSVDQYDQGKKVSKKDLRLGDLVFFNTSGNRISHVGIYLGDNTFIHASSNKGITITELDSSYYSKRYVGATRVLNDEQFKAATSAK